MFLFFCCFFAALITTAEHAVLGLSGPSSSAGRSEPRHPSLRLPLNPVTVPLTSTEARINHVLHQIVDSTTFFENTKYYHNNSTWSFSVPVFEATLQIELQKSALVLTMVDGTSPTLDFGWICLKFYECRDLLKDFIVVDTLQAAVAEHFNLLPADPGIDAAQAGWSAQQQAPFQRELIGRNGNVQDWLQQLEEKGFMVIDPSSENRYEDSVLETTSTEQDNLSKVLQCTTTGQGSSIRTDQVHFLSRSQAVTSGVSRQYDFLFGLANYFNTIQDQPNPKSKHKQPIAPATLDRQLTIPDALQYAAYANGDFYTAHSDNSLTDERTADGERIRSNFRAYTCILYLNDNDWNVKDGGALRIFPESQHHTLRMTSRDLKQRCGFDTSGMDYVDHTPRNGRLIIFDSRLLHEVKEVTATTKIRRALTLWINRPTVNSGVKGETYF